MDHAPQQDSHQNKGSMFWHREHSDGSVDWWTTDNSACPQDEIRPIRRVPSPSSPSRPRGRTFHHYNTKHGGQFYRSREEHLPYKPGFSHQRPYHLEHRTSHRRREHFQPKHHHTAPREREREREKEQYEWRDRSDMCSPPSQSSSTRAFSSRSTSSRDKDMQFSAGESNRNQSRDRDHRGTKSKEREQSWEEELPSAEGHAVARDRAIQRKRREIDEEYYQECEMFGLVTKMLIEKDPSLEHSIQASLQKNLRDIGKRCVEAMEKFIQDYDSQEHSD